jgi:hypothetical protein
MQRLMNVGLSAGGRDCPLASLGDDDLQQSAEVFVQNVCGQGGCEHRPTDCLRILGPTQAIQDVDLQRADIAMLMLGDVRTVEPMEGFFKAPAARRVFASRILRIELTRGVVPTPGPPVITSTLETRATRTASRWLSASASFVRCSIQSIALSASIAG